MDESKIKDIKAYLHSNSHKKEVAWPEHIIKLETVAQRKSAKKSWREYCENFEIRDEKVLVYTYPRKGHIHAVFR
jgi:hypothetical protein